MNEDLAPIVHPNYCLLSPVCIFFKEAVNA